MFCPPSIRAVRGASVHSFNFRSKKVRAKCMITAPVVTCSELRIWKANKIDKLRISVDDLMK